VLSHVLFEFRPQLPVKLFDREARKFYRFPLSSFNVLRFGVFEHPHDTEKEIARPLAAGLLLKDAAGKIMPGANEALDVAELPDHRTAKEFDLTWPVGILQARSEPGDPAVGGLSALDCSSQALASVVAIAAYPHPVVTVSIAAAEIAKRANRQARFAQLEIGDRHRSAPRFVPTTGGKRRWWPILLMGNWSPQAASSNHLTPRFPSPAPLFCATWFWAQEFCAI
jgi:hypothetical protein